MDILIRSARILNSGSNFHNQVRDIWISNGKIKKIAARIQTSGKVKEVKGDNLHVSLGWVDMNVLLNDPGHEQKETIESGCRAAAFGGFTHICAMPNNSPVTQTKSQVEYILRKSMGNTVSVHPIGAVTQNCEGKELAEMMDMKNAGAIAFSDGLMPSPTSGTVERALLYVKAFDGLVINHPEDRSISKNGAMNEGVTSTKLGLPGAPALAEEVAVNRDLYLLEYTDSRLHFLDISLKKSADLIRQAKKKGLKVTASVNAYNLLLEDSSVGLYNTFCKVNPHLRTKEDRNAIAKAIADGTIDTISSAHQPHDEEGKKLEFDKADFGMIGLETCFAVSNTALDGKVKLETIVAALSDNARAILGLNTDFAEGADADLTIFNPDQEWKFEEKHIGSLSKNTPFIGYTFKGRVIGIYNNNQLKLNNYE